MKTSASEYEIKILRNALDQMRDPENTLRQQTLVRRLIFGLGYFGLITAFIAASNGIWHSFTTAFLASVSGCGLGFAIYLNFAHRQWLITRRHFDLESVKKRLAELGEEPPDKPNA